MLCGGEDRAILNSIKSAINASRHVAVTNLTLISTMITFNAPIRYYYTGVHLFSLFLYRRVSFLATVLLLLPIYRRHLSAWRGGPDH